jgi:DNA adenine methylase
MSNIQFEISYKIATTNNQEEQLIAAISSNISQINKTQNDPLFGNVTFHEVKNMCQSESDKCNKIRPKNNRSNSLFASTAIEGKEIVVFDKFDKEKIYLKVSEKAILAPDSMICDLCNKIVLHDSVKYKGFRCADTNMFIGSNCKDEYYKLKNAGEYGKQHANKFSEVPVPFLPDVVTPNRELPAGFNEALSSEEENNDHITPNKELPDLNKILSFNDKIKHICHAINPHYEELINNSEWLKRENQKIFPFTHFSNFHVSEMKLVCDGCGEAFDGNGSFDTAYFVLLNPDSIRLFHDSDCMNKFGLKPNSVYDYKEQKTGFLYPIELNHTLKQSELHSLVFDEIGELGRYRLNQFVPNGIPTVDFMRKSLWAFSGQGGGTARGDKGNLWVDYNNFNVRWAIGPTQKPLYKLSPIQLLKIINEILKLSPIQDQVEGFIILDQPTPKKAIGSTATKTTKRKGLSQLIDQPINGLEALLNKVEEMPAATPKKKMAAKEKSINESYPGGKNASGTPQFLINQIPPVDCIVSGFLGHCAIMKNIKPAKHMIGMDIDKSVIDRWNKERGDIKLIADDFLKQTSWINPMEMGKTLVFLDPPYLLQTRSSQAKIYDHEFYTEEQHIKLLERAIKFPAYVMICAYENELYDRILIPAGFRKVYYKVQTQQGRKEECLYMNYPEPTELHDYSFFGADYRERYNNKKMINRLNAQLNGMPALRRNMIIHNVQQNFKTI